MFDQAQWTIDTALENGPFVTLSILVICGLAFYIIASVKQSFSKKEGPDHHEIQIIHKRVNKINEKLDEKLHKIQADISDIRAEVSFIYGKLNSKGKE